MNVQIGSAFDTERGLFCSLYPRYIYAFKFLFKVYQHNILVAMQAEK